MLVIRSRSMTAEVKRKNRNGKIRSILLPSDLDQRLDKLCAATGENRNALVKLVAATLTPQDVEMLKKRL